MVTVLSFSTQLHQKEGTFGTLSYSVGLTP